MYWAIYCKVWTKIRSCLILETVNAWISGLREVTSHIKQPKKFKRRTVTSILQMNLSVWGDRVLLCQEICTREGDVSHHYFSTEIKLPFHSVSNPEEISQDLRSADCTGLHETVLPVLGERRPEYRNVMYSPYPPPISLKLEYACLPTWKSQGFTPHLTPAFDFFPPSLIPFKFIAYRERWHARDTNQVPRLAGKAVISPWKWWQHVALQSSIFRTDSPGWQTVTVPIYADVDGATQ